MSTTDIHCEQLVELTTAYLEAALPPARRAAFDAHLAGCPWCVEYVEQMRGVSPAVAELRTEQLAPERRDALLDTFRRSTS